MMMPRMTHTTELLWREYDSGELLAEALAAELAGWLRDQLARQSALTVALPGGRSPWPVYRRLAQQPLRWSGITIVPTDDRRVPVDDPLSNFAQLKQSFGTTGAKLVPLIPDATLSDIPWPPALTWLGMGLDGHTASIFPGPDLQAALQAPPSRRAIGVLPDPLPAEAPVARVTLTCASLLSARRLIVVIHGAAKRQVLEQAWAERGAAAMPIVQVLAQAPQPVEIFWSPT